MHHEGSGGAVAFLNAVCERSPESCEKVLKVALRSPQKEEVSRITYELIHQRADEDAAAQAAAMKAPKGTPPPPRTRLTDEEITKKAKELAPERSKQRGEELAQQYYEEAANDWQEAYMRWKLEKQIGQNAIANVQSYYAQEGSWLCAYRRWFLEYIERQFQSNIVEGFVCDGSKLPANVHAYKVVLVVGGQHPSTFQEEVIP